MHMHQPKDRFRSGVFPRTPMTTVVKTNREAMRWFCTHGSYVLYVLVATAHLLLTGYGSSFLYQLRQQQYDNSSSNDDDESRNSISSKSQSAQDEKGDTGKKMGKNNKDKNSAQGRKTKHQKKKKKKKGTTPNDKSTSKDEKDNPSQIVQDLAGSKFMPLCLSILGGLGIKLSSKHNAKYGLSDLCRVLLSMCSSGGGGAEANAEAQHRKSKTKGEIFLPSRSWTFDMIKEIRHDFMLIRSKNMITRTVMHAKRRGMLRRPVDVSIDMHDIPFYAKCMNLLYAVKSKCKKGTTTFVRLATIHCVVNGSRLTLGVEVVCRKDDTSEIVTADRAMQQTGYLHIDHYHGSRISFSGCNRDGKKDGYSNDHACCQE